MFVSVSDPLCWIKVLCVECRQESAFFKSLSLHNAISFLSIWLQTSILLWWQYILTWSSGLKKGFHEPLQCLIASSSNDKIKNNSVPAGLEGQSLERHDYKYICMFVHTHTAMLHTLHCNVIISVLWMLSKLSLEDWITNINRELLLNSINIIKVWKL